MKSIFKKIAFVLALAMVITMLPAKAVSAAASNEPGMYKSLLLYLDSGNGKGSDITGTFASERYASVWGWRENGYNKPTFVSADPDIATVNGSGKVTAVKVGKTSVIATFTGDGMATVEKTCVVTVKQNATRAGLSTASTKKVTEEGIEVGEEYQLVAVRKDEKGNTVTSGRDVITDGVRFESSNPEIFTVGKTKGKITGVSEGTAKLYVWSVQSEGFDAEAGEYPATTEKKEYEVKIVAKDIVAKQSAYNAFILTFPNPEEAKAALTETKKSLTDANAAVSEAEEIVKVYKVLTDSNNARREVFVGGVAYKDGAEGVTSSIEVTMFNELDEKSTYVICYKGQEMTLQTPEYIADGLMLGGYAVETAEDYSVQELWANLYTADGIMLGNNGGSCHKYLNWQNSLVIEDTNTALVHNEYQFDSIARRIWFYTTDRNYKVTLKGTFEDWANITAGNQAKIITAVGTVSPNDSNLYVNNFVDWCIVDGTPANWDANWSNKTFASEDNGFHLLVKANVTEIGRNAEDLCSDKYSAEDYFTFVSSNDDKLAVNKDSGELYPPKTATNGTVGIHVYYKGVYVGTCPVQIVAKRTFATFSAGGSLTKMSYSTSHPDVNESITITLYPKDQLGANFNNGFMRYEVSVSEDSLKPYFANSGKAVQIGNTWDGYPQFQLTVADGVRLPENIVNVRVKCVATYIPQDGSREIVKQYPVSFSLKDTTKSTSTSFRLSVNKSSVDMKIEEKWNNGVVVGNNVTDKNVTISAYGYDKDGYKVEKLILDGSKGNYNVTIKYGSVDVPKDNKVVSGNAITFKPVITVQKQLATISGSAVVLNNTPQSVIEKLDTGSYVIALYAADNSYRPLNSVLLNLTDSQTMPSMTWVKSTTDAATILSAIQDAVKVTYPNSWTDITKQVYYGYAKYTKDADGNVTKVEFITEGNRTDDGDYTLTGTNGQNLYIARLRCVVKFADDWYEFEIPVKRTVVYGTNIYN